MPKETRRQTTPGPPVFGERAQRRLTRARGQSPEIGEGRGEREIAGGKHILPLQREQKIDLAAPAPEPAHRGDRRDRRLIRHRSKPGRAQPAARESLGEGSGMENFRARKAGPAQHRIGEEAQPLGGRGPGDRGEPAPDRSRRLIADLLAADRLEQAGETLRPAAPGQGAAARLDRGEPRVARGKRRQGRAGGGRRRRERGQSHLYFRGAMMA